MAWFYYYYTFNLPRIPNLYYFDTWLNATPTSHLMCDRTINMMIVAAEWLMDERKVDKNPTV